jgi:hypothetical protein
MPIQIDLDEESMMDRLAAHFEEIYIQLSESGVPEERLPSPWHILSHVIQCVDYALLREWIEAYIALEAEEEDDEDDEGPYTVPVSEPSRTLGPPLKRSRPEYLRPLPDTSKEVEEEGEGAAGEGRPDAEE